MPLPDHERQPRPVVLIADDEESAARATARELSARGFDTEVVFNHGEAAEQLASRRFDVLLAALPAYRRQADAFQSSAREPNSGFAILLIIDAEDVAGAAEYLKQDIDDYVIKPVLPEDLAARVHKTLDRRGQRRRLETRVAEQAERLRKMLQHSLGTLIQALEAKDEFTRNHSARVSELATLLAGNLCPDKTGWIARLRVASLFHDIGKIGIPESILNKPGKLDESEMAQIQRHPEIGETIMRPLLEGDAEMLAVVRNHHEQWDGDGYPDGLAGESIPLAARVVAVAVAFDAMISVRPHRPEMTQNQALQVLREGSGSQWDPIVVEALLELIAAGALNKTPDVNPPPNKEQLSARGHIPASSVRPVLPVEGDLTEEAMERLTVRIGGLMGQGDHDIVLDLRTLGFLDRAAVNQLFLLHQRAKASGGALTMRDAPGHALRAFRDSGFAQSLRFEQSSISALRKTMDHGSVKEQLQKRRPA